MIMLALASVIAVAFLAAQPASAETQVEYQIKGNSCTSITSHTIPGEQYLGPYGHFQTSPDIDELQMPVYTRYGVHDGNFYYGSGFAAGIDVTCPIFVPRLNYTRATIIVYGYNRSGYDKLSCTIEGTDAYGNRSITSKAELEPNIMGLQHAVAQIFPTFSGNDMNSFLSLTCHLPAKNGQYTGFYGMVSHLTTIWLQLTY
jgi:hypothetical protein